MSSLFNGLVAVTLLILGGIAITTAMPAESAQSATTDGLSPVATGVGLGLLAAAFMAAVKAAADLVKGI